MLCTCISMYMYMYVHVCIFKSHYYHPLSPSSSQLLTKMTRLMSCVYVLSPLFRVMMSHFSGVHTMTCVAAICSLFSWWSPVSSLTVTPYDDRRCGIGESGIDEEEGTVKGQWLIHVYTIYLVPVYKQTTEYIVQCIYNAHVYTMYLCTNRQPNTFYNVHIYVYTLYTCTCTCIMYSQCSLTFEKLATISCTRDLMGAM